MNAILFAILFPFVGCFADDQPERNFLAQYLLDIDGMHPQDSIQDEDSDKMNDMSVEFTNLENEKIQRCFMQVYEEYASLHSHQFEVKRAKIKGSTMMAQPVIRLSKLFSSRKRYRIKVAKHVRDSKYIKVENVPDEVLVGWFAHEMGHVVDYAPYGNLQMIGFGIKYLLSAKFKQKVEYEADYIAIQNGFKAEIIACKRFILESGLIDQGYIDKISRFYLPIDQAELYPDGETILPTTEL